MLGDFQDISVQTNALRMYENKMEQEKMLTNQALDAMELLVVYMNAEKQSIRNQYVENFTRLSSKNTESRFMKLFNAGS